MNLRCFSLWLTLMLLLALGLTACDVSTAKATPKGGVSTAAYGAQQLLVSTPIPVKIVSELAGEIQVISYPAQEVAVDSVSIGSNGVEDTATLPESKVTLEFKDGGASIRALPGEPAPERILLHVRVPHGSSIEVNAPRAAADVTVAGEVKNVTVQIRQGDIAVRGATGDLNLRTERGAINVDEHDSQNHTLELHATEGGITLFALDAKVVASTTNGSIQFVGTLTTSKGDANRMSEFTVTGAGNVSVALPDNARFRYRAFGGSRVVTDVALDTESCGLVSTRDYDFRRRALNAGDVGRLEVGGTVTSTNQVQGTYGKGILYFETNRELITVFDPPNPPPRSGGPAGNGTVGDCGQLSKENLAVANIDFTARADSGSIWIHQIKMK